MGQSTWINYVWGGYELYLMGTSTMFMGKNGHGHRWFTRSKWRFSTVLPVHQRVIERSRAHMPITMIIKKTKKARSMPVGMAPNSSGKPVESVEKKSTINDHSSFKNHFDTFYQRKMSRMRDISFENQNPPTKKKSSDPATPKKTPFKAARMQQLAIFALENVVHLWNRFVCTPWIAGWWLGHPSEKYEFVNWDD